MTPQHLFLPQSTISFFLGQNPGQNEKNYAKKPTAAEQFQHIFYSISKYNTYNPILGTASFPKTLFLYLYSEQLALHF